jgi:hypothetical protein
VGRPWIFSGNKKTRLKRYQGEALSAGSINQLDREGAFDFLIRAGLLARGSFYRPPLPA